LIKLGIWALKNITLNIKKGEIIGVIGKNGAGKSTLLKVLSRITSPTKGEIKIYGKIASLLEVGTGFHPELTGRENIFLNGAILGMTTKNIGKKIDEIIEFSGIQKYIDTPIKRYSTGMTVRLGFSIAAYLDADILFVDEVLAVGDADFRKKALNKMNDLSDSDEEKLERECQEKGIRVDV
jgi:lipopolysaccharide transport system ATP-binding protein